MKRRVMSVLLALIMAAAAFTPAVHAETDYSEYSNKAVNFSLNLRDDHKKPSCAKPKGVKLKDYDAYYYGTDAYKAKEKVCYLTFDCGYENGYTKKILKTLKKNNIKAIFFITKPYVEENPEIVKQMKEEGHLVGNHTCNHPRLCDCSVKKIKKEINGCAKAMKKLTGYEMDYFCRPPEGAYSKRVLKVLQDMGYATMFWSLAYYDYEPSDEPGADMVVNKFKKHYFPGLMPLMHVISKSNRDALPRVIKYLTKKGYRFGEVTEFVKTPKQQQKEAATIAATEAGQMTTTASDPAATTAADPAATTASDPAATTAADPAATTAADPAATTATDPAATTATDPAATTADLAATTAAGQAE